jgi:hypothetical protein
MLLSGIPVRIPSQKILSTDCAENADKYHPKIFEISHPRILTNKKFVSICED